MEAYRGPMDRGGRIPRQVRRALPALMLVMFLGALDQTAVASALPEIAGELGRPEHISLIAGAYFAAATVAMPLQGIWVTVWVSARCCSAGWQSLFSGRCCAPS